VTAAQLAYIRRYLDALARLGIDHETWQQWLADYRAQQEARKARRP
jgi:hypothetical protein